jgi:hypothetical protein
MADASAFVLDSFALLAYLQGEKNGVRIREIFQSAQSDSVRIYISLKYWLSTSKQSLLPPTLRRITQSPTLTLLPLLLRKRWVAH